MFRAFWQAHKWDAVTPLKILICCHNRILELYLVPFSCVDELLSCWNLLQLLEKNEGNRPLPGQSAVPSPAKTDSISSHLDLAYGLYIYYQFNQQIINLSWHCTLHLIRCSYCFGAFQDGFFIFLTSNSKQSPSDLKAGQMEVLICLHCFIVLLRLSRKYWKDHHTCMLLLLMSNCAPVIMANLWLLQVQWMLSGAAATVCFMTTAAYAWLQLVVWHIA